MAAIGIHFLDILDRKEAQGYHFFLAFSYMR